MLELINCVIVAGMNSVVIFTRATLC